MGIQVGTQPGEYPPIVYHVADGEPAEASVLTRPTTELDARTEALRIFVDAMETGNTTVAQQVAANQTEIATQATVDSNLSDAIAAHSNTSTMHTTFATNAQASSNNEDMVVSPKVLNELIKQYLSLQHTYVVGTPGSVGVTHGTLIEALTVASPGDKILITTSQLVDSPIVIAVTNIEIEFRRGVIYSAGSSSDCFLITADDVYLSKATIQDFSGNGVTVGTSIKRTMLRDTRYIGCTTALSDSGILTTELGNTIE